MSGVRNTLGDLNNFLFAQLERLDNEELEGAIFDIAVSVDQAYTKLEDEVE